LSSTLVPILAARLLRGHSIESHGRFSFAHFQHHYGTLLTGLVKLRWLLVPAYLAAAAAGLMYLLPQLGTEIFPKVDMGQFQMRLRAPTGTRIERTEALALQAVDIIKQEVGKENVQVSMGFAGIQPPSYPINTIYLWTGGPEEAVLQVELKHDAARSMDALKERLRQRYAEVLPDVKFSFEPSDIVSRVMSFGSPTPVEVAVSGPDLPANRTFAEKVRDALAGVPSLRDLQIIQTTDYPSVNITVDRERAGVMGVTMTDVARSMVSATSSSRFVVPVYWADPKSGVAYQIQVEIPQGQMNSIEALKNIPVARKRGEKLLLQNVADVTQGRTVGKYDRYNMQRMVTLTANIGGEDLGRAARRVNEAIAAAGEPPQRVSLAVRGQIAPMIQMLAELQTGLILAVVVILLLLAANYQSFILAITVVSTVPAVLLGVAAALFFTGTTLNIQSFMGAIMAIGVSVANAILLVTFAERARAAGNATREAAVQGATSRLRPILMTSVAMIAGMMPIALGVGEGAEQSAPLGWAVIGGLAAATVATLMILPAVFALVRRSGAAATVSMHPDDMKAAPE
ncbi:MAG: efflux RND transporter permease subunit, partial [Candidatus Hydrogenedentes bacterium]|nr:efflux RND transporter permease subunit [Candidatus Hydrogenedentota bacterium]